MYRLTRNIENININKLHDEIGELTFPYSLTHDDKVFNLIFKDVKKESRDIREEVVVQEEVEISPQIIDDEGNVVQEAVVEVQDVVRQGDVIETIVTYYKKDLKTILEDVVVTKYNEAERQSFNLVEVEKEVLNSETGEMETVVETVEELLFTIGENGEEIPLMETVKEPCEETIQVEKEIEVWVDCTVDFEGVIGALSLLIDSHDPLPSPRQKTQLEALQETVDMLLIDSLGGM